MENAENPLHHRLASTYIRTSCGRETLVLGSDDLHPSDVIGSFVSGTSHLKFIKLRQLFQAIVEVSSLPLEDL